MNILDFMWGAAKEPLDSPLTFDGDGLALAFKYFNSSTLTMRLAGVAQINAHIAAHNELCAGDTASDAELAGQQLAQWLTNNNIIEHLFGPNLHVEVRNNFLLENASHPFLFLNFFKRDY